MATTAEPTTTSEHSPWSDDGEGLGHGRARSAASPDGVRAPGSSARRCRHQDHLRGHLSFRPAHRAQRLGRNALSGHPRSRDRRHGHCDRRRSHASPGRRHGRGRLHGRQLHGMRPVPGRLGSLLPQGLRPDLQQRRLPRRYDQQGRLHRPYRRPRPFLLQGSGRHGREPRRASALRRHHDLFAPSAVQRRSEHEDGRRRPRRPWPHGREARRRAWALM